MPTLEWIGKDKVVNHHQEVPFRSSIEYIRPAFAVAEI